MHLIIFALTLDLIQKYALLPLCTVWRSHRWLFRYPDETGWLDTFHPPYLASNLYSYRYIYLTTTLLLQHPYSCLHPLLLRYISLSRVQPSIPSLITLLWGLCACDLWSGRWRRQRRKSNSPPRNRRITKKGSILPDFHLNLYNASQSHSHSCSKAHFPKRKVEMFAYQVGVKSKIYTFACKSKI